jgi:murein DD-endopeptidase MepM/ murein hydrolase activator NlpD
MGEADLQPPLTPVDATSRRGRRWWLLSAVPAVGLAVIIGGLSAQGYLTQGASSQALVGEHTLDAETPTFAVTAPREQLVLLSAPSPTPQASAAPGAAVITPERSTEVQPTATSIAETVSATEIVAEDDTAPTITPGDNAGQDDHPIIANGGPTEILGPDPVDPAASTTPSAFANDTLTDVSKVPGAQWIDWPAYTPAFRHAPVPSLKGTGVFTWPAQGYISTPFSTSHEAIDIAGSIGVPLFAADTGTVVFAAVDYGGLGLCIEIAHGNGYVTTYGHLSAFGVKEGQVVSRGQYIGRMGSTGHSTGPHVHFAIKFNGRPINPLQVLRNAGAGPHPQVTAPSFESLSLAKATQLAQQYHLVIQVNGAVASSSQSPGNVASQEPPAGSLVDTDSTVMVQVVAGPGTPTSPYVAPTVTPANTPYSIGGDQANGAPIVQTSTPTASATPGRGPRARSSPTPKPGTATGSPTHGPIPTVALPEP